MLNYNKFNVCIFIKLYCMHSDEQVHVTNKNFKIDFIVNKTVLKLQIKSQSFILHSFNKIKRIFQNVLQLYTIFNMQCFKNSSS